MLLFPLFPGDVGVARRGGKHSAVPPVPSAETVLPVYQDPERAERIHPFEGTRVGMGDAWFLLELRHEAIAGADRSNYCSIRVRNLY